MALKQRRANHALASHGKRSAAARATNTRHRCRPAAAAPAAPSVRTRILASLQCARSTTLNFTPLLKRPLSPLTVHTKTTTKQQNKKLFSNKTKRAPNALFAIPTTRPPETPRNGRQFVPPKLAASWKAHHNSPLRTAPSTATLLTTTATQNQTNTSITPTRQSATHAFQSVLQFSSYPTLSLIHTPPPPQKK